MATEVRQALIGPRQVGKTTLAHQISEEYRKALCLDLENQILILFKFFSACRFSYLREFCLLGKDEDSFCKNELLNI
ncbi:MAG: hypothetical protein OXN83_04055 [Oligoflexia bacterium]|nr:hypothetical protein [Oligoflexia bacterium]